MGNLEKIDSYINEGRKIVEKILKARRYSFHNMTPSNLPDKPGIYVIFQKGSGGFYEQGGRMIKPSGIEFMGTFLWEIRRLTLEHVGEKRNMSKHGRSKD